MKIHHKITFLLICSVAAFLLIFVGYQYIRNKENRINREARLLKDEQIIDKILEFKKDAFMQPTADNSSWDEMVDFVSSNDSSWSYQNFSTIVLAYGMTNLSVYDTSGDLVYNHDANAGVSLTLQPREILSLFNGQPNIHLFDTTNGQLFEIFGSAIVPVNDPLKKGKAHGYLISTKVWNESYLDELSKVSGFHVHLVGSFDTKIIDSTAEDRILKGLNGSNGFPVAKVVFSKTDKVNEQLGDLQIVFIMVLIMLVIFIIIIIILVRRWFSNPLRIIVRGLSGGNDDDVRRLTNSSDEFGKLSELILQYNEQKSQLQLEISEKEAAATALKEAHHFSDMIYKVIPSAVYTVDLEHRITSWNKMAETITGYTAEETMGKNCSEFALAPCSGRCGLFDINVPKPIHGRECLIRHRSGKEITVLKNADLIVDGKGKIIGGIESFEDITLRKQNEIAILKSQHEAEKANNAKSEFLAMMSHEIRTPMNAVIGMTELTLTTRLTPIQREYLEAVNSSALSLLDTLNDILDFSKIEAGKLEIENEEFDMHETVERCVEILNVKAFSKKIELLLHIDPSLPRYYIGDALRIRQVLINLISNAIKFTNEGEICVKLKSGRPLMPKTNMMNIEFFVIDTGIGIKPEKQQMIFKGFEQADRSITRRFGGTGLGLSISKSLVAMMGGEIHVESEEGRGSTFSFTVPLTPVAKQEPKKKPVPTTFRHVLVVDDNNTNLTIIRDMLAYWNIPSTVIQQPLAAIEEIRRSNAAGNSYDLVILDMQMPEIDGISLAAMIKKENVSVKEPLILMYSSIEKEFILERGKKVGIHRFLSKPVKMRELQEALSGIASHIPNPEPLTSKEEVIYSQTFPGKSILVVEDNPLNLKLMNALLAPSKARILNALNGQEAFDLYRDEKPDLIFMDVHMPVMDGFQATRRIRCEEGSEKRVPIIALTASAMKGDKERCLECGMNDYLSKPFQNKELIRLLAYYLSGDHHTESTPLICEKQEEMSQVVFDRISLLEKAGGNQSLCQELIQHFMELMPGMLNDLRKFLDSNSLSDLRFSAHAIKGMSGNMSALKIHSLSGQIEVAVDETASHEHFVKLITALCLAFDEFKKHPDVAIHAENSYKSVRKTRV
jgi:PAS domain S-box-containing protein